MSKRIVVLISGSGSNLQAIMNAIDAGQINGRIEAVLSNKAEAYGLERANNAKIPAITLQHVDFDDRESFDQAMIEQIDQYNQRINTETKIKKKKNKKTNAGKSRTTPR
jgi:phosphoribosylglycinamide formyltransferase-1